MLQTIWDEHDPMKPTGHRRGDLRRVMHGRLCRRRTGCQWNQLPKPFGDDSTGPRHVPHGCQQGLFEPLWAGLVDAGHEWGGVDWQWQAADPMMGQARMGGDLVGRHPTDRGQQG
jgi:transposase